MIDRLTKLLNVAVGDCNLTDTEVKIVADYLLSEGVIVPPCKVGDMIYMPWEYNGQQGIACLKITSLANILDWGWDYGTNFITDDEGYAEKYNCGRFRFEDFGKTVFLTREEAEAALAERSEG